MIEEIKQSIRNIPDFPKKGIQFKDLTTAWLNPAYFQFLVDHFYEKYKNDEITKVVGIEARGFVIGAALAYKLNAAFVPIRKPGKLPAEKISVEYDLEYGTNKIELHKDALSQSDKVLLHDDLLATGGTVSASLDLMERVGVQNIQICFIAELDFLDGRSNIDKRFDIYSMIHF